MEITFRKICSSGVMEVELGYGEVLFPFQFFNKMSQNPLRYHFIVLIFSRKSKRSYNIIPLFNT